MRTRPGLSRRTFSVWFFLVACFACSLAAPRARAQPPVITTAPLSKIATVGQTVTFTVAATGTAPISYQWKQNRQVIAGSGSTLNLPSVTVAQRGFYEVIVSNAEGSATSTFGLNVSVDNGAVTAWGSNEAGQSAVPAGLGKVAAVAAGVRHSLVLRANGTVAAWGENGVGQSNVPAGLEGVVAISAGAFHNLALRANGSVVAWGDNFGGKANVPSGLGNVVAISAGWDHNLALKADGTVVAWGFETGGSTVVPSGLRNVVGLATADGQSFAIRSDGFVTPWGGSFGIPATVPTGLANVLAINSRGSANSHILALEADGTVTAWGYNGSGQTAVPTDLPLVTAVAAGGTHSLVLTSAGAVVGWGGNTFGQAAPPPGVTGISAIAAGFDHNLALYTATAPSIVVQPQSRVANVGTMVRISVEAIGSSPLAYQWEKNGVALNDGGNISGAKMPTLVLDVAGFSDSASYTVKVSNAAGTVTSAAAILSVVTPPTLTSRPLSRTATAGQTVSFSVVASGSGPFTYLWKRNRQVLPAATAGTLTLNNVSPANQGTYEVIVTNAAGGTTSSVFMFAVGPADPEIAVWGAVDSLPADLGRQVVALGSGLNSSRILMVRADGTVGESSPGYDGSSSVVAALTQVVGLSVGSSFGAAVKSDGSLVTWGSAFGMSMTPPSPLSNVVAVSAGSSHLMALLADGTVVAWGSKSEGEVTLPNRLRDVIGISAGFGHSLALRADGTVVVWGREAWREHAVPETLQDVISIAAGSNLCVALKADGTVVAWGRDYAGSTAVPAGLSGVVAVTCGTSHSLALKSDGTVVAWGRPYEGQTAVPGIVNVSAITANSAQSAALIAGAAPTIRAQPSSRSATAGDYVQLSVGAVGSIPFSFQWKKNGVNVVNGSGIAGATSASLIFNAISAADSGSYTVEVTNSRGTVTSEAAVLSIAQPPVITARPLSRLATVGEAVTMTVAASDSSAISYQWKRNGQIIVGATGASLTLAAASLADRGFYEVRVSNAVGTASSFFQLAVSTAATQPTTVVAWGGSDYGATRVPDSAIGVVATAAADYQAVALKSDGTLLGWGHGAFGSLLFPTGLDNVVAIAAGSYHTLALRADGSILSFGSYNNTPPSPPVLRDAVAIAARGTHCLALKADGTVVGWGGPVVPQGLDQVIRIAAGRSHGLALRLDGSVRAWGANTYGQTDIPAGLSGVVAIAVGEDHSLAVKSNGTVVAWGRNNLYQCAVPVGLSGVTDVAASFAQSLAVKADGTVVAWGTGPTVPAGLADVLALTASGFHLAIVPASAPLITASPSSRFVNIGEDTTLTVTSRGAPLPTYQWLKDGEPVSGATTASYTITNTQISHAGTYAVVVTNVLGTQTSASATISVAAPATITARPLTRRARVGDPATFSVQSGDTGATTYQWKRNRVPIPGQSGASLVLASAKLADRGNYEVVVTNAAGGTASSFFNFNVAPVNCTVAVWGSNSQQQTVVPSGLSDVIMVASASNYVLALRANGTVVAWGQSIYGSMTPPAGLTDVVDLAAGESHALALKADGTVVAWGIGGEKAAPWVGLNQVVAVAADNYSSFALRADGSLVGWGSTGTGSPAVPNGLRPMMAINARLYGPVGLRPDGTVQAWNGTAPVNAPPVGLVNVARVAVGYNHALALLADGVLTTWGLGDNGLSPVPEAAATGVREIAAGYDFSMAWKQDGSLIVWGRSDMGQTSPPVGLTGVVGIAAGTSHGLALVEGAIPVITNQPGHQSKNPGETATFTVGVTGYAPQYQWRFRGEPLAGATSATLAIANVQLAQAGDYTVVVSNAFGSVTSNVARLHGPNPSPTITAQPEVGAVVVGQNLSLSVSASGTGSLSYQWRRNGVALVGATSATLNLGAANYLFTATYDVLITDGLSFAVSRPSLVEVAPPSYPAVVSAAPNFAPTFESRGGDIGGFFRLTNGRVMVAGSFSRINGTAAGNVARLNADGAVDPTFNASRIEGSVYAVSVQSDGKLLIGGNFIRVSGAPRAGLARLNADGTLDPSFAPDADYNSVYTLGVQTDGKIIVGGGFAAGVARVNIDGTRDSSFPTLAPNGSVNALAVQADGKIVLGGSFTSLSGQARSAVGRLNADGTLDTSFSVGTGFNNSVFAVRLTSNGGIMLAGAFTGYQGAAANRIIRLLASGARDSLFVSGNGFNSSVYTLELQGDGKILAGGAFGGYGVTSRLAVARLLADGPVDTTFVPLTFQHAVVAISYLNDGTVLVGGGFSSLGTSAAQYRIARLSANGSSVVAGFGPGLLSPGLIFRVSPAPAGKLLVAGSFSHVNGTLRENFARLNADGSLDSAYNNGDGANGPVRDLALAPDGSVTMFGSFGVYNGIARVLHARLSPSGALVSDFAVSSGANGEVSQVVMMPDQRMLIQGGTLTSYSGVGRSALVMINPNGTVDSSFDLGAAPTGGSVMMAAVQSDAKILVAGSFFTIGGAARARLVRLLPSGKIDATFSPEIDDVVSAVAVQSDGKILIAGDFLVVNSTPRARLARLLPDGSLDATFNPDFYLNDSPQLLRPQADGRVLLAGKFTAVGDDPSASYLIRLRADGRFDSSFSAPGLVGAPSDVAVMEDGSLVIARGEMQLGGVTRIGLVRTVSQPGPVLLAPPVGGTALAGAPVTLGVSVAGGENATYQWLKAGAPIFGATSAKLSLPGVQAGDAGAYSVRISHGGGNFDSPAATVVVTASAPLLSASAATISGFGGAIKAGSRWALTAPTPVFGSTPITYQWSKNGALLAGATDRVFSPSSWQTADAGSYQVTLGNSVGSVTASPFPQAVVTTPDWDWRLPSPQGNAVVEATYLNGRFLLGGVRGTVLTSTDGLAWSVRRLGISNTVVGFAYGASIYVALSSSGVIWSSPDALTWTQRESGVVRDGGTLHSIAFGAGRFVAVGSGGALVTSVDGVVWTRVGSPTTETLSAVVYGGGRFVALGAGGRTFTSLDGLSWASGPTLARAMTYLAFGAGRYVAAAGRHVFFSSDAVTWNARALATTASIRGLKFTDVGFLATVDATSHPYWKSLDGHEWAAQSTGQVLAAEANTVTAGGGTLVLGSSGTEVLWVSVGGNWARASGFSTVPDFTAAATDGTTVVAVGGSTGGVYFAANSAASSPPATTAILPSLADVTFGAGRFVAVAPAGRAAYSTNGISWIKPAATVTNDLLGVNFVNGRFIATGVTGALLTSPDGDTWTTRTTGTTQALRKVAYGAGVYLAVGAAGTVIGSSDSIAWSPRTVSGITSTISDVVFAAGQFVLVSEGGSIRTSPDGATWTAQVNPLSVGLKSLAHTGGKFYAFTTGNTNYLTSPDGFTWTPAQHGNANTSTDAVVAGDKLFLVGPSASIVSLPLNVPAPVLATAPSGQTLPVGGTGSLTVAVEGPGPFAYQWFKNGTALIGANFATLTLANITAADAGAYTVTVTSAGGTTISAPAAITIESRGVINTAARASVGTGTAALTGAFTIEGSAPKPMLIRGAGPALTALGVSGALVDPQLVIEDLATGTTVASNDDWGQAANLAQLTAATVQAGAVPFANGSKDAAALVSLAPGTYRARLVGAGATTGLASLEIYDVDTTPRLVYLGTRARVGTGGEAFVQGFALAAVSPGRSYLIRALGSALGLSDALADPHLAVFSGATQLAANDNGAGDSALAALTASVGAMPLPAASKDAAVNFIPAAAGAFTVQVSGAGGSTGLAVLEIFEADAQRAATVPLAIVSAPENVSVVAGQPAAFGVVTVSKPAATYRWSKDGTVIAGATQPLLSFPRAQVTDAGTYSVFVSNGGASAFNSTATLSVAPASNAAHALVGRGYVPGGALTVTNTLHYVGAPTSLEWSVTLPAGWSLLADGGATGDVRPAPGANTTLTWRWNTPPPSPVSFTYTVAVPASENLTRTLAASAVVALSGVPQPVAVVPSALSTSPVHSADTDGDGKIGLVELTRVIELYNVRLGTLRTGRYLVATASTEDGFAPDTLSAPTAPAALLHYHSSDTNRDARLSLTELTRVIELFNVRAGPTRTGAYRVALTPTEDGFTPDL